MPPSAFRLLVFDWDGTLMDSVGPIVECTRATMRELDLDEPAAATVRGTVGLGLRETMDRLVPRCDDALYERVLASYRRHWIGTYRDLPLLFAGVDEMLGELRGAGYLLGVATGKTRRGLDHALAATGLAAAFDATRTADEAPSKPHPQMLLDLCDELGVRPQATLMVGDSVYDLEMAAHAGSTAAAALTGAHSQAELEAVGASVFLPCVTGLGAWLAGAPLPA